MVNYAAHKTILDPYLISFTAPAPAADFHQPIKRLESISKLYINRPN